MTTTFNLTDVIDVKSLKGGDIFSDPLAREELRQVLKKMAAYCLSFDTESGSVPAGPDSSRFRASKSGKAFEVVYNHTLHGGSYGFDRLCAVAVKIGSNIPYELQDALKQAALSIFGLYKTGSTITGDKYGTNFSTVYLYRQVNNGYALFMV